MGVFVQYAIIVKTGTVESSSLVFPSIRNFVSSCFKKYSFEVFKAKKGILNAHCADVNFNIYTLIISIDIKYSTYIAFIQKSVINYKD